MLTFARLHPLNRDADHRRGIAYKVHRAAAEKEVKTNQYVLNFSSVSAGP